MIAVVGGVLGGALLVGLSYWAIAGAVGSISGENGRETGGISRAWLLVKFFTRHVILAAVGYGMMVRLHLDPVAMMVGVTVAVLGFALAAARR